MNETKYSNRTLRYQEQLKSHFITFQLQNTKIARIKSNIEGVIKVKDISESDVVFIVKRNHLFRLDVYVKW